MVLLGKLVCPGELLQGELLRKMNYKIKRCNEYCELLVINDIRE